MSGDGLLNVWMHDGLTAELGIRPGERYELQPITTASTIVVRIAGTWSALDVDDPYWPASPNTAYRSMLLIDPDEYASLVEPHLGTMPIASAHWAFDLSEEQFVPELAAGYLQSLERAGVEVHQVLPDAEINVAVIPVFEAYLDRLRPLRVLLLGLSVPILSFVLYFAGLVSSIAADAERQTTSILMSRGASDQQILALSTIEGGVLLAVGSPLGIALGLGLGRLMASITSFMQFGSRASLPVSLSGLNPWLIAVTMAVSLLARVYPAWAHRGQSILAHSQEVGRQSRSPFWQRYGLDLLLTIPTAYFMRQLSRAGSISIGQWQSSGDIFADPAPFLVPALFILTSALLAARLIPLLLRLLDRLFSSRLPVTMALTLQQLARRSDTYSGALLLITVTMAIGVFVSSTAQSLDGWLDDRIAYQVGGDVSFQVDEGPTQISAGAAAPEAGYVETVEPSRWLVPLQDLAELPGVAGATWTGRYRARMLVDGSRLEKAWFRAIDRSSFPTAVRFRHDFASESLGSLMNRLAVRSNGVLVSERYLRQSSLRVGDPLKVYVSTDGSNNVELDLIIVGSYSYWPTVYEEQIVEKEAENNAQQQDADALNTVIGNLDYLMSMGGGIATYDVWLRADRPLETESLRRDIAQVVPYLSDYQDVWSLTAQELKRKERIGTYGVLTFGFAGSLLLAVMGLSIQHHRSLEMRLWRFAALRAIGLGRRQLRLQLQLEYLIVLLWGLLAGTSVGIATARFFVPYYRIKTPEGVLPLPPLTPSLDTNSIWVMAATFVAVQVTIQSGLLHRAMRTELFQILRMGARE